MKRLVYFILIGILIFSFLSITVFAENDNSYNNYSSVTLRAGGGGSGGGSGGGGGSSGGSTHHSGTGRQPTLFESIIEIIMLPFILFSSTIVFYVKTTKRSRKSKKLMKKIMQSDNAWKFKDISSRVSESYFAIQTAWSNMDMTPAAQYMSDELYSSFQTKLNWMIYKNERNVLENIQLIQSLPVAVHDDIDNSRDFIWFYIKGRMIDYIIDTDTQLKISGGSSPASFIEYWQFIRKDNNWVLNKILQKDESDQIPFTE